MTLYLKYRPKNLDELDETSVSESLKKIISKGSIPHAFLFAGPKGTGKTSAARILAKILNCENLQGINPCNKCDQCISVANGNNLDVIEMDAASHRGIDDVRLLRDAVKLAPVSAKKKVYIIDEVHMLTVEASNALLKTLEEPPEHVVFILATTNPEKLIETIKSRTTLIQFRKAGTGEIVRSLKRVVKGEKIQIDDDSLALIAASADGSFRDGIKILEQLTAEVKDLSKDAVGEFLFKNKSFDLDKFVSLLAGKNIKELLMELDNLNSKGAGVEIFLESLIKRLQSSLLAKIGIGEDASPDIPKDDIVSLIDLLTEAYGQMGDSPIDELPLELALIKWCGTENPDGKNGADPHPGKAETETDNGAKPAEDKVFVRDVEVSGPEQISVPSVVESDTWKRILDTVKPVNASMEALLRAARPISYNGKELMLGVYYKFHKERLDESKHRKILEEIVGRVLQSPTKVSCVLVDPPPKKIVEESKAGAVLTEAADKDIVKAAEEIFGN